MKLYKLYKALKAMEKECEARKATTASFCKRMFSCPRLFQTAHYTTCHCELDGQTKVPPRLKSCK